MFFATMDSPKSFMHALLIGTGFDRLMLREASITTFVTFRIEGNWNAEFTGQERPEGFCRWEEVKEEVVSWVRGAKTPRQRKLVFSASDALRQKVAPSSSVLFLNVTFEEGKVKVATGASMASFQLDRSAEYAWDGWTETFLRKLGLHFQSMV